MSSGVRVRARTVQGFTGRTDWTNDGGGYWPCRVFRPAGFGTSVGVMSVGAGRGCALAMWEERRLIMMCSPQYLQSALASEIRGIQQSGCMHVARTSSGAGRIDHRGAAIIRGGRSYGNS